MDLQPNTLSYEIYTNLLFLSTKPAFYYQLLFSLVAIFLSSVIARSLRTFLSKKTVSPMQRFKVVLLGIYVHIEPHLFFIIALLALSIGYKISSLNIDNYLIITISQMVIGLFFIGKILSKYLKGYMEF